MEMESKRNFERPEDVFAVISDLAGLGAGVQRAIETGMVSDRMVVVGREIFSEILDIAASAEPPTSGDGT